MFKFNVICHTENCENAEISIEIMTEDAEPIVICGACAQQITDITPIAAPKK